MRNNPITSVLSLYILDHNFTRKKKFCELKKREYRDGVKSEETR